jgi:hypothetical protein
VIEPKRQSEGITTEDWYAQLVATAARVSRHFSEYLKEKQDELI